VSDNAIAILDSEESDLLEKIERGSWTRPQKRQLVERACRHIAAGTTLTAFCRSRPELPAPSTMIGWLLDDEDALALYLRAEQIACVELGQRLMEFAQHDDPETDNVVRVSRAKLVVDTAKWKLARMLPKLFGDKMNVEHSGNVSITLDTGIRRGASITATQDAEIRVADAAPSRLIDESPSTGSLLD
jgi:hypothetical protein